VGARERRLIKFSNVAIVPNLRSEPQLMLSFISGNSFSTFKNVRIALSAVDASRVDFSLNITAPTTTGHYFGKWILKEVDSGKLASPFPFLVELFVDSSRRVSPVFPGLPKYYTFPLSGTLSHLPNPTSEVDANSSTGERCKCATPKIVGHPNNFEAKVCQSELSLVFVTRR